MVCVPLQMLQQMASSLAIDARFVVQGAVLVEFRHGRRAGQWTYEDSTFIYTPASSAWATLRVSDLVLAVEAATGSSLRLRARRW